MADVISFDTGIREYDLNGVYTARFNPTDENIMLKIEQTMKSFDEAQKDVAGTSDFSLFINLDKSMRAKIDDILGDGAADALFPDTNCFALADGLPVFMNLLFALLDVCHDAYEAEYGKTDGRFKAYSSKYSALRAKYAKK